MKQLDKLMADDNVKNLVIEFIVRRGSPSAYERSNSYLMTNYPDLVNEENAGMKILKNIEKCRQTRTRPFPATKRCTQCTALRSTEISFDYRKKSHTVKMENVENTSNTT